MALLLLIDAVVIAWVRRGKRWSADQVPGKRYNVITSLDELPFQDKMPDIHAKALHRKKLA
jgi:hypothetical protein